MAVETHKQEGVLSRRIGSHRGLLAAVGLVVFWWTAMAAGLALVNGSIWGSVAVGVLFTVATLRVIRGPWGVGLISAKLSKSAAAFTLGTLAASFFFLASGYRADATNAAHKKVVAEQQAVERAQRKKEERRKAAQAKAAAEEARVEAWRSHAQITRKLTSLEQAIERRKMATATTLLKEIPDAFTKVPPFDALDELGLSADDANKLSKRVVKVAQSVKKIDAAIFDDTYKAIWGAPNPDKVNEERAVRKVARKHKVKSTYVDQVLAENFPEVERRLKAENAKIEAERRRARKKLVELCGPKPLRSGWDGEIPAAETYVEEQAHDPGSIEVTNCTDPVLTEQCWQARCDVRGKNAFGAKVFNRRTFYMKRNPIVESMGLAFHME